MKLIKIKKILEINKEYYKIEKMVCDNCNNEIKENDLFLEVNYHEDRYDESLLYKHFCTNCMKNMMFEMFMNNDYTDFNKYKFIKSNEWHECFSKFSMEDMGMYKMEE